jgi:PIN domain nuclease of toxin-antitoxin system
LPWFHRDPFDRLIAAQTLDLGWSLLSKDVVFDAYGVRRVWS